MITSRIDGLAIGDSLLMADVAGAVFGFAVFFAMDQTLEMILKNLPAIRRKCIEYLANLIDGSLLLFGQLGFFAIKMLRTVVPCHFAPIFFVGTDLRLKMSAIAP